MKNPASIPYIFLFILIAACASVTPGQGTAFTYQGKLTDGGTPANATYDLSFRLYDTQAGGSQIGTDQVKEDVTASNGIFTVVLDFGSSPFTSNSGNYLEISVRPGASTGAFTTLAPRQPITSSPYAVQTIRADSAALADNASALGGTPAASFVQTTDTRLSDARPPTAGSANYIQNGTGVQPLSNFSVSGNGTAGGTLGGNVVNAATHFSLGGIAVLRGTADPSYNLFAGLGTGQANTTGVYNSMFGAEAGVSNSTGGFNSFFGSSAGYSNTTGIRNAYVGASAGAYVTSGNENAFLGAFSGGGTANQGSGNSFIGFNTGRGNSTGQDNSFFGHRAGTSNVTGSQNTLVGSSSDVIGAGLVNASAIGHRAAVSQSNSLILGSVSGINSSTATVNVGIGTTAPSQRLHVVGNGLFSGDLTVTGNLNATLPITGTYIQNTTSQQTSSNFNISGDGTVGGTLWATKAGIGTGTPTFRLQVADSGNAGLRVSTNLTGGTVASFGHLGDFMVDRASTGPTPVSGGRLSILETGNVGIGTPTPAFRLEVQDSGTAGLRVSSSGGTVASFGENGAFRVDQIDGGISYPGRRFSILDNGNVGIGTNAPTFKLHTRGSLGLRVETTSSGGSLASFGHFGDFTIDRLSNGPNPQAGGRFSVLEGGNVGVSTAEPSFRFHVRADGQDGIKIQHSGTGAFPQIRWTDSADTFKASIGVDTSGTGSINFFVNGSDRMVIESNGRVRTPGGIFIANPNTLVITSPDGACWGITVSNAGVLGAFSTPCP